MMMLSGSLTLWVMCALCRCAKQRGFKAWLSTLGDKEAQSKAASVFAEHCGKVCGTTVTLA
jgi:hypothetical protein